MCAINVAHLETQGIFWTSQIGAESLFLIFFYMYHQRGAFGNPGNFLDFKNRRGIPIFIFLEKRKKNTPCPPLKDPPPVLGRKNKFRGGVFYVAN